MLTITHVNSIYQNQTTKQFEKNPNPTTEKFNIEKVGNSILIFEYIGPNREHVKKNIRIEPDSSYTYKLLKTKIKAREGASGLYSFMDENRNTGDLFYFPVLDICKKAVFEMKEATT